MKNRIRWILEKFTSFWWGENGQLRREVEFQHGNISGKLITYWDNGQIKRTNRDGSGNTIPTKCFDRTGKEVPVYPMASTGKYDDGKTTVSDYLIEHIVYPKEERPALSARTLRGAELLSSVILFPWKPITCA